MVAKYRLRSEASERFVFQPLYNDLFCGGIAASMRRGAAADRYGYYSAAPLLSFNCTNELYNLYANSFA
jgi:hypothetical protein